MSPRLRARLTVGVLEPRDTPSGVPGSWSVRGSGGGGALFSPAVNPANPAEMFVSSDMSQLFRTADGGATWAQVPHTKLQGGHETEVQYTNVPGLLYAVDYTNVGGLDLTRPAKSTDGGATWTPLPNDPTGGEAYYLFADPANSQRLLLTDYSTLYSSADGGATWAAPYTAATGAGLLAGGAFFDGTNVYVGTNDGLLTSTNGGAAFAKSSATGIPAGQAIRSFAGGKTGSTIRFVAVTDDSDDVYAGVQGYDNNGGTAVYTMTAGAAAWTARSLGSAAAWPFFAGMARTDASAMYAAGGSSGGTPTVFKSGDGGATWAAVLNTAGNANVATGWSGAGGDRDWSYGEVAMGFAVSPADPNRVVITDYGFAHGTSDGGKSWQALYVNPADRNPAGANTPKGKGYRDSGLDNTTSWQVAWADAKTVLIANSDVRGQRSTDGGTSFGFGYAGHTQNSLYRVAAHANGKLYAATGTVHDLYQSTYLTDAQIDGGTGQVIVSADKGATWSLVKDFGDVVSWVTADPANPERLYASVVHSTNGGVYVTNNLSAGAAATWTKLPAPPRTQGHAFNVVVLADGTLVASFSGRRAGSPLAFTASSGVFVSTNGGATWADRSDAGMRYWTKDVVVDPHDPTQNSWYAGVFSGWGGPPNGLGGLYKTTNRGVTWTKLLGSLDRVTSAAFDPADANEMYVTTEVRGLWYSANARAATPTFAQVASYPFRQPERVFFNPHAAGEVWVTSFGGGVMVGQAPGRLAFARPQSTTWEGASAAIVYVSRVGGSGGAVSAQFHATAGTATAGADFGATHRTLAWAAGDTAPKAVRVPIFDDKLVEAPETVQLALDTATGGAAVGPARVLTIIDDETAGPHDGRRVFVPAGWWSPRDPWSGGVYVG